jgi:hypothetical protein
MTDFLRLLKDDAYAASFQTMGQYRTALIAAYRAALAGVTVDSYSLPAREGESQITIQRAQQKRGPALWKVTQGGNCLTKDGHWEYEPLPSSRDDAFLARCRFETADAAIAAALTVSSTDARQIAESNAGVER